MRRSSKGSGRRTATKRQPKNTGTIKSIERQRGTGSIAPSRDAEVRADTGFTNAVVVGADFDTLAIGDQVQFDASLAPDRLGYADASLVRTDTGLGANEDHDPVPSRRQPKESAGLLMPAVEQSVRDQDASLASGEENPS